METLNALYPLALEIDDTGAEAAELSQMAAKMPQERAAAAEVAAQSYLKAEATLRAVEAALEPLIKEMQTEISHHKNRVAYFKALARFLVPPETGGIVSEMVNIQYGETIETVIDAEEELPWSVCKQVFVPDKTAIRAALEAGETVNGARLQTNYNIRIKPASLRAVKAATKKEIKAKKEIAMTEIIPQDVRVAE